MEVNSDATFVKYPVINYEWEEDRIVGDSFGIDVSYVLDLLSLHLYIVYSCISRQR